MKAKAMVRFILVGALLGCGFLAAQLNAAELTDVRVGAYETFTRVVFQFDAPTPFRQSILKGQSAFNIRFSNSRTSLSAQSLRDKAKGLTYFRVSPQASDLEVDAGFPFENLKLKTFTLKGPFRIVVDVYETKPPPAPITIKDMVIKDSMPSASPAPKPSPPPAQSSTAAKPAPSAPEKPAPPSPVKATPSNTDSPSNVAPSPATPPKPKAVQSPPKPLASKVQTPKVKTQSAKKIKNKSGTLNQPRQRYLTIILIAIGCAIVILVGFILIQKRRAPKPAKYAETEDLLESTEEVLSAIDAKIKEKLQKYK